MERKGDLDRIVREVSRFGKVNEAFVGRLLEAKGVLEGLDDPELRVRQDAQTLVTIADLIRRRRLNILGVRSLGGGDARATYGAGDEFVSGVAEEYARDFIAPAWQNGLISWLPGMNWGVDRGVERIATGLGLRSMPLFLANYAVFAHEVGVANWRECIHRDRVIAHAGSDNEDFNFGMSLIPYDQSQFRPRIAIGDLGCGAFEMAAALGRIDKEIFMDKDRNGLKFRDVYDITGYALRLLESINASFKRLLKPKYKSEKSSVADVKYNYYDVKALIKFLASRMLFKAKDDDEFREHLNLDFLDVLLNPKEFLEPGQEVSSYPTSDEETFVPWGKTAIPSRIVKVYYDATLGERRGIFDEIFIEGWQDVITSFRHGEAFHASVDLGDFKDTICQEEGEMDVLYSYRGTSHVPDAEYGRYLMGFLGALGLNGVFMNDDIRSDSALGVHRVYHYTDVLSSPDCPAKFKAMVFPEKGHSLPPRAVYLSRIDDGRYFDFWSSCSSNRPPVELFDIASRLGVLVRRVLQGRIPFELGSQRSFVERNERIGGLIGQISMEVRRSLGISVEADLQRAIRSGERVMELIELSDAGQLEKLGDTDGDRRGVAQVVLKILEEAGLSDVAPLDSMSGEYDVDVDGATVVDGGVDVEPLKIKM